MYEKVNNYFVSVNEWDLFVNLSAKHFETFIKFAKRKCILSGNSAIKENRYKSE